MEFKVELSETAVNDVFEIYYYIAMNDSFENADRVIEKIKEKSLSLSKYPERGSRVNEIYDELPDIKQVYYKHYRIIYRMQKSIVYVLAVLDGRRNLEDELRSRLIR
jgi:toxin ParE1/3/4